jgi:F0F1-type ATP synthase assembly protein I
MGTYRANGAIERRRNVVSEPTRRERFRPLELLVISAIVALFVGLVVWGSTRDLLLGGIFGGVGFIVAVVVFAMLALASRPDGAEKIDLDDQDRGGH